MNEMTPRSTPELSYTSLVSSTDSSLSSYREHEEYEIGAYSLNLEPIYHNIEVISLNIDVGNETASEDYNTSTVPRAAKTISFDSSADKSPLGKEKGTSKHNKKKHAKSERLRRGVEEWRDVVFKEHRRHRKEDR
jgi:hypothetical protein